MIKIRLMYMIIGLLIGVAFGVFQHTSYNEERTRTEAFNESLHQVASKTIASLTVESRSLKEEIKSIKQHTKIVETKNADGSSSRVYENDLDSTTETRELVLISKVQILETEIKTLKTKHSYELALEEKSRPSAQFSLGLNTRYTPYFTANYNFYGPLLFNGYTDLDGILGVGLGLQF